MTTETEVLLPCPFCGYPPLSIEKWLGKHKGWQIFCHYQGCGAAASVEELSEAEALAEWNRRAYLSALPDADGLEVVERLSINFPMMHAYVDPDGPFIRFSDAQAIIRSQAETIARLERERDEARSQLTDWQNGCSNSIRAHAETLDRLEAAEARASRAMEVVRPFAEVGRMLSDEDGWADTDTIQLGADPEFPQFHEISASSFRAAREFLEGGEC